MKILAFSDWRIQDINMLIEYIKDLGEKLDIIVYAGDDIYRFGTVPKEVIYQKIMEIVKHEKDTYGFVYTKGHVILWMKNICDVENRLYDIIHNTTDKFIISKNLDSLSNHTVIIPKSKLSLDNIKIESLSDDIYLVIFDNKNNNVIINKFMELSKFTKYGVFGVLGNDDSVFDRYILKGKKVFNLHEKPKVIEDYLFIGQEGIENNYLPLGNIYYSEKEIYDHLTAQVKENDDIKNIILVSHSPPYGILDIGIRFGERHIGSHSIRRFIEKNKVLLNICGHVHMYGGKFERYGNCTILNIASHDNKNSPGKIAIVDIENNNISINIKELYSSELINIYGIGEHYSEILKSCGIKTIDDFLNINTDEIHFKTKISKKLINKWKLHAKSLKNKKIFLIDKLNIKNRNIYIDIETNLSHTFIWMITIYDSVNNIIKQFVAKDKNDEKDIINEFINYSLLYGYRKFICFSGSDFDKRILMNRVNYYNIKKISFIKIEDIFYEIRKKLIVPISRYTLKDLGTLFGYKWKYPGMDGIKAFFEYNRYLETKDKNILKNLEEYGKDDVYALDYIINKINKMIPNKLYSISEIKKL